ncbi:oligosaccharide flippase family protein [Mucilaginibacter sp. 14171R-50]|uniref:oligosaccharide flippase family protein n=1 Tax=Mucilaginibacter sp. 14171R-50 TaxID=2703789 RepID=UPI00138CD607|nr:oligosaccharide flippase family protein [Mucilaginibacter sp. 14171R-50]QHS54276.1 oligosaccharide flippase family protein [Mucilaginibacter sp. 14171R-50]
MKASFLKELYSVFVSRVAVIAAGIGGAVVTARYLGPEGNGVIAALMVYPSLFMTVGSLGIRQAAAYFVGQQKYELQDIYGAVLAIWLVTSVFCVASSYLLIKFFTKGIYSETLILLAVIAIPFSLYSTYSSGIFLGKQDIKEFNKINWIPAVLNFAFTFILVAIVPLGVAGSMLGTFIGAAILPFFIANKIRKVAVIKPVFNGVIIKGMLSLGIVYAISLLVTALNYKVDIILLNKYSTISELGIYSKSVNIVQYLWEVPTLVSTIVFSRSVGAKDPQEISRKVCRLLRFSSVIIIFASILMFLLSPLIIKVLFGAKFAGSVSVLNILLPGVLLLTVFKVLNMDIAGKGKPWLSMKAMVPAVIINIILNILWVPGHGANGSAAASLVSYTFASLMFLYVYSKEVKMPIKDILKFTSEDKEFARSYILKFTGKTVKHDS